MSGTLSNLPLYVMIGERQIWQLLKNIAGYVCEAAGCTGNLTEHMRIKLRDTRINMI